MGGNTYCEKERKHVPMNSCIGCRYWVKGGTTHEPYCNYRKSGEYIAQLRHEFMMKWDEEYRQLYEAAGI